MAARKSCTHLTWAEAKSKVGDSSGKKANKKLIKKVPHDQALLHKVIAKSDVGATDAAKTLRKQRKAEARAIASAERRAAERKQVAVAMTKPYDASVAKLHELAQSLKSSGKLPTSNDPRDLSESAQCRSLQVDELMALGAMLGDVMEDDDDEDDDAATSLPQLHVLDACRIEELRGAAEAYQMDESDESLQRDLVRQPALAMCLELEIEGITLDVGDVENADVFTDVVAHLLLQVTLPPQYPLGLDSAGNPSVPIFEIVHCFVTDRAMECPSDTPLESLAFITNEANLKEAMGKEARQMHPDLSVYAVAVEWLTESLGAGHLQPNPHAISRYAVAILSKSAEEG